MIGSSGAGYPWRDNDVVTVVVTALLGVVAVMAAWFGASGEVSVVRQVMWLNLAVGGFVVFAGGNGVWLLRLRRAIGDRRVRLVSLEADDVEAMTADAVALSVPPRAGSTAALRLVRGVGMARVHDPGCPLVAGKAVQPAVVGDGEPCGVCGS